MKRIAIIPVVASLICIVASAASAQTNNSVGRNGATAPTSTTQVGFVDANGILQPAAPGTPIPVTPAPSSGTGAGLIPSIAGSASSSTVVKASAGNFYGGYVTTNATAGYLMLFNATSKPADGATTAGTAAGNMVECLFAPANATTSISYAGGPPEVLSSGITLVFSSTGCATLTGSATAYLHGSAF